MKKNTDKNLLNEELKRFKLLNEYDFYIGEDDENEEQEDNVDNLILGEEGEEDEENTEDDLGIEDLAPDDSKTSGNDEEDVDLEDDFESDDESEGEEFDDEDGEDFDDIEPEEDGFEDEGGEVELDVTDLVKGTEEAKETSEDANEKINQLLGMVDDLEGKLSSMDNISDKIGNLEHELEKRAPTPEEKIEMRSLDSYPYNLKLTDFWEDKTGQYDVMDGSEEDEEEFVLKQKDVDEEYNESQIENSFVDDNPYEEEEF